MSALAVRPDLSKRTGLSKSALTVWEMCQRKAWYEIHDRRPLEVNERITFGRAVDVAVETLIAQQRAGQSLQLPTAYAAAAIEIEREPEIEIDFEEVQRAIDAFPDEIMSKYDWTWAVTQRALTWTDPQWGRVDTHPDILIGDGSGRYRRVRDVKTGKRSKTELDVRNSTELGFYAIAAEQESGYWPDDFGYFVWVRRKEPAWQDISVPLTDGMVGRAFEIVAGYVRATKADEMWNLGNPRPVNATMTGGPRFRGICGDCQYRAICPVREEYGDAD